MVRMSYLCRLTCAAANPAIALWLQANALVGRVAELGLLALKAVRTLKAIIPVLVVLYLCGCGSVAPYHFPDTGAPADLHAVNATRVTVKKEFRYSPTLTSYVLPAGDYVPVGLNAGGTYYESPRGILVLPAAGSSFLVRGGIYRRNKTKTSY